jgi:hypothetical protein
MSKQTAVTQLIAQLKEAIGKMNGNLNPYQFGYKQCLIDVLNSIQDELLPIEKEQLWQFFNAGIESTEEGGKAFDVFYNETYEGQE